MGGTAADLHGFPCAAFLLQPFVRDDAPGLPLLLQIVGIRVAKAKAKVKEKVKVSTSTSTSTYLRRRVCKPSSVPGLRRVTVIYLDAWLPARLKRPTRES